MDMSGELRLYVGDFPEGLSKPYLSPLRKHRTPFGMCAIFYNLSKIIVGESNDSLDIDFKIIGCKIFEPRQNVRWSR